LADADPVARFARWFRAAKAAGLAEPHAMTLATATADGRPSARMVLLKGFDDCGFVFYSNYRSRKGRELHVNPRAALVFYWHPLRRQVRIEGRVRLVSAKESDAYFASRPRGSQLGAAVSPQSRVIPDRGALESALITLSRETRGMPVPRPTHWGGYRLIPESLEFWEQRENRLHDRLRFRRVRAKWVRERLAP
jgi:pyridoxamine 5'-phosphate oxidase